VGDDGRVTDVLETALRDLIADAAAHHREREQPSRKMFAIGALLVLGAGIGAILVQWSSPPPREQTLATSAPSIVAAPARAAVAPTEAKPAQSVQSGNIAAPASPAPGAPPATSAGARPAATADVAATTAALPPVPAQKQPAATANIHPSWLVEDDPVTFQNATGGPNGAGTSAPPPPSWYVEDDPASYASGARPVQGATEQAPIAAPLRRMVVTADVEVRAAPDAKSESIGVLKAGAAIAVGDCTLWCAVNLNARSGWVFYTFLAEQAASVSAR
jgi:hypothetical protein